MSFAIWVGRGLTADGLAYLAGYGDEPSSHWLEVVDAAAHPAGATIEVGVWPDAPMPGRRTSIPQVAHTHRHLRVSYSYFRGVPAPLTNGGVNEHGVAVRDVWSPSRAELVAATPPDQSGLSYSDLARTALERATSAREAMEILGELVDCHGDASYGGNSHLVADADEAWVVVQYAGGLGLWCAERLGPHDLRVSRPGWIGVVEPGDTERIRHSANFFDVARDRGWWRDGEAFDACIVYGDGCGPWPGARWVEEQLRAKAPSIALADVADILRSPQLTGDTAGYGQIVPLGPTTHPETQMMWHAAIGAIAAPFVPVYMGVRQVPEEYRMHRYLTVGESSRFVDRRHADRGDFGSFSAVSQGIESTRSAVAVHKRLLYLVLQHHEEYLPEVRAVWEGLERRLERLDATTRAAASVLLATGRAEEARDLLTYVTTTELTAALDLADTLAAAYEARTRAVYGINPTSLEGPAQLW
jgi:hypothetical protein